MQVPHGNYYSFTGCPWWCGQTGCHHLWGSPGCIQHLWFHLRIRNSGRHCLAGWGRKQQNLVYTSWGFASFGVVSSKSALHKLRDAAPGTRTTLTGIGFFSTITVLVVNSNAHQRPETRIHHSPGWGTQEHLRLHSTHLHITTANGIPQLICRPEPSLYIEQITHSSENLSTDNGITSFIFSYTSFWLQTCQHRNTPRPCQTAWFISPLPSFTPRGLSSYPSQPLDHL